MSWKVIYTGCLEPLSGPIQTELPASKVGSGSHVLFERTAGCRWHGHEPICIFGCFSFGCCCCCGLACHFHTPNLSSHVKGPGEIWPASLNGLCPLFSLQTPPTTTTPAYKYKLDFNFCARLLFCGFMVVVMILSPPRSRWRCQGNLSRKTFNCKM